VVPWHALGTNAASTYVHPVPASVLARFSGCSVPADASSVGDMTRGLLDPTTITAEMAAQIRTWRVDEERSWQNVAAAACDLWGFMR
jgi:hypothetical protein